MKSPKCQADNPETATFCADCGTQLIQQKDTAAVTRTLETPFPQFSPGTSLANRYEIIRELGKGGMGEVYLAEDTTLKRQVAIKVLPQQYALDKERLARFEREARLLASLNHPNIATIHGLEKSDDQQCLVMELVEGDTLAERLKKGPLPVEEALEVCQQIAEGLESAHEKGIIHRDLKPGNIKITPEGKVKILDFGLAKAFHEEPEAADLSQSPTLTDQMTQPGMILGTAFYMSPEQVRGKVLDKRADIWAFGCCLYEALTGKVAFLGETISDSFARVLEREPDWDALPEATPGQIRVLIQRCLRKNLMRRLHHISDARIEIEDTLEQTLQLPSSLAAKQHWMLRRSLIVWSLLVFAIIATAVMVWILKPPLRLHAPSSTSLGIILPRNQYLVTGFVSNVAISPDGRNLVYVAGSSDLSIRRKLYLRALDSFRANPIPGTEDASTPFFSPNGQWIGFFAQGKLWKVPITGGMPVAICDAARLGTGASWGRNDTIIFTVFGSGLLQVSANGGQPEELTSPDLEKGELGHQWPQILEKDKGVLFGIVTSDGSGRIVILSPATGEQRELFVGSDNARYLRSGHLVYAYEGSLWAVPFDLERMKLNGSPIQILDGVSSQFTVSETGSIVYGINPAIKNTLVWVDREGQVSPIKEVPGSYSTPRLSPDGRHLAFDWAGDIWILDLERSTRTRLTAEGRNYRPIWTPDGFRITFATSRSRSIDIYWKLADGSGEAMPLLARDPYPQIPLSWSLDGKHLLFREIHPESGGDIWVLSRTPDHSISSVIATKFLEGRAAFSPDGDWLVYVSNESGRSEVYVQPFPGPGKRWQISPEGGSFPVWSADGTELFYRQPDGWIMSVVVETEPVFVAKDPQRLFEGRFTGSFDVTADGQRFVMAQSVEDLGALVTELRVVLNWFEELKRLAPSGN